MARSKFPVEVLTPEGVVFDEEVEMVSTRTAAGSVGIHANHEPMLATLEPTELRLYRSETEVVRFAQSARAIFSSPRTARWCSSQEATTEVVDRADARERLAEARRCEAPSMDSEGARGARRPALRGVPGRRP